MSLGAAEFAAETSAAGKCEAGRGSSMTQRLPARARHLTPSRDPQIAKQSKMFASRQPSRLAPCDECLMPRPARSRSRRTWGHVPAAVLITVSIALMASPRSTLALVMREGKFGMREGKWETACRGKIVRQERAELRDRVVLQPSVRHADTGNRCLIDSEIFCDNLARLAMRRGHTCVTAILRRHRNHQPWCVPLSANSEARNESDPAGLLRAAALHVRGCR